MSEEAATSRQKIMAAAADLFYRQGYRAVGIDTIVAESGVGKMTLYRHYASKDELIAAYLEERDAAFWAWFEHATAPFAGNPRRQLLAFFDSVADLASKPTCHGCPFLNAVVDFPDPLHPGHQAAFANKRTLRERFQSLCHDAGAVDPDRLADQLLLLMDGAFMSVRMFGPGGPAVAVSGAAAALLDTGIGAKPAAG